MRFKDSNWIGRERKLFGWKPEPLSLGELCILVHWFAYMLRRDLLFRRCTHAQLHTMRQLSRSSSSSSSSGFRIAQKSSRICTRNETEILNIYLVRCLPFAATELAICLVPVPVPFRHPYSPETFRKSFKLNTSSSVSCAMHLFAFTNTFRILFSLCVCVCRASVCNSSRCAKKNIQ